MVTTKPTTQKTPVFQKMRAAYKSASLHTLFSPLVGRVAVASLSPVHSPIQR
ncbi:unnamed protein product, partial [Sphenostylis stenocarpa]